MPDILWSYSFSVRNLIPSSHDLFDNATGNVGQSKIATGTAAGEPLVIETEQVQDCGVQVVYVGRALGRAKVGISW
jgi:hypothetical protein